MLRLNPEKLHVTYLSGTISDVFRSPRRYTLTHSDITGELFLSIGNQYDKKQTSKVYTRFMRDEVLGELLDNDGHLEFNVYCHISGGFVFGTARLRYNIFKAELRLALEAIRYGDRTLFEINSHLDEIPVKVNFKSTNRQFNQIEDWGKIANYR